VTAMSNTTEKGVTTMNAINHDATNAAPVTIDTTTRPRMIDFGRRQWEAPSRDLGPNQLAWLRANIPAFKKAERDVIASEENRERVAMMAEGVSPEYLS